MSKDDIGKLANLLFTLRQIREIAEQKGIITRAEITELVADTELGVDFEKIDRSIIPDVDNIRDLGTASKRWKQCYATKLGAINCVGDWTPETDNAYDLGTSALRWRNIYAQNLGAITVTGNWIPLIGSAYDMGSASKQWWHIYSEFFRDVNGNLNCQGNVISYGVAGQKFLGTATYPFERLYLQNVASHLNPLSDNAYDLGTNSLYWRTLYLRRGFISYGSDDYGLYVESPARYTCGILINSTSSYSDAESDLMFSMNGTNRLSLLYDKGTTEHEIWFSPSGTWNLRYRFNNAGTAYADVAWSTFSAKLPKTTEQLLADFKKEMERPNAPRNEKGNLVCDVCGTDLTEEGDCPHLASFTERFAHNADLNSRLTGNVLLKLIHLLETKGLISEAELIAS